MAKKMISLEISDELREALRVYAFEHHITVSAAIRKILELNFWPETQEEINKETK